MGHRIVTKKIIKALFVAAVVLMSIPVEADILPFTPDYSDVSMSYLRDLFGNVGSVLVGGNSQFIGQLFYLFNIGLISVLMLRVSANVFTTVLLSSTEGSGLARKVKRLTAFRSVVAAAALVPGFKGYSAIQVIMMTLIVQGVGLANAIWNDGLSYVVALKGAIFTNYTVPADFAARLNPSAAIDSGKHNDLNDLVSWADYKYSIHHISEQPPATAMHFFQSAVCSQLMYYNDKEHVGRLRINPEQYKYRMDQGCFATKGEYEQEVQEEKNAGNNTPHYICFGGSGSNRDTCGKYRYQYSPQQNNSCRNDSAEGGNDWKRMESTFGYDPGYRAVKAMAHSAYISGKSYAASLFDKLDQHHGRWQQTELSFDITCDEKTALPGRCHPANNLVAAATDFYILTRGPRISMCRDQQQREVFSTLNTLITQGSNTEIQQLIASYQAVRQKIYDNQEVSNDKATGSQQNIEDLFDQLDAKLKQMGDKREFYEYILDNPEQIKQALETYESKEFNWVQRAQKEGWITAGHYYTKLLSQGKSNDLGYNKDNGFSSVIFAGANSPSGIKALSIASLDGFFPKVVKLPSWDNIKIDNQNIKRVYNHLMGNPDKTGNRNYDQGALKTYAALSEDIIEKMMQANQMKPRLVGDNDDSDESIYGKAASHFISTLVYSDVKKPKWPANGYSLTIPVSTAAIIGSIVISAGDIFMPSALMGLLVAGVDIGVTYAFNVPLDHVRNNLMKMTNVVLAEMSGIRIYQDNLLSYKIFKKSRFDEIQSTGPCFNKEVVRYCAIGEEKVVATYGPKLMKTIAELKGGIGEYKTRQKLCMKKAVENNCIVPGKGLFGGYALEQANGVNDPLAAMKNLGVAMMSASTYYWAAVTQDTYDATIRVHVFAAGAKVAMAVPVIGALLAYQNYPTFPIFILVAMGAQMLDNLIDMVLMQDMALMKIGSAFGAAIAGVMYSLGSVLGIYLPLLPVFIFILACIGWLILAIEGMIAAPLVALGLAHPSQHDLLGKANEAGSLLLMIFIRPTTILIGYFTSMMLMYVSMKMLNQGMMWYLGTEITMGGFSEVLGGGQLSRVMMLCAVLLVYTYAVYQVLNQCFAMMYKIPEKIMRWIDPGHREPTAQMIEQATEEGKQSVEGGSGQIARGAGEVAQKDRRFNVRGFGHSMERLQREHKEAKDTAEKFTDPVGGLGAMMRGQGDVSGLRGYVSKGVGGIMGVGRSITNWWRGRGR